ncbi:unnamed protein product [Colias eurytheme]|nr:unnamed protein product [Colias eurytheme]
MNPSQRPIHGRLKCINCNICINTLRRFIVLQLDSRIISLISSWIDPIIITEDDYICEACHDIAMRAVNDALNRDSGEQQAAGSSHQGHTQVCVLCGLSILRRRSDLILRGNGSYLDRSIANIVQSRIAPREITSSQRICHPCWLKCRRSALRAQEIEGLRSSTPVEEIRPEPDVSNQVIEHHVEAEEDRQEDSNVPDQPVAEIILQNYRRAANTASHCLFAGCVNTSLHTISDSFRATILGHYKFYIPLLARVCAEHLYGNNWDSLYDLPSSIKTFTVQQIEHVFSFVASEKTYLDFSTLETIQEIDDNLFFYWIGRSKQDFIALVNEVPRIQDTHRGILGLGTLLMKLRTGESDDRISKLIGVPRRTMERLMNKVRELLVQDFVPSHLGLSHISRENLLQHNLLLPNGIYNNDNNEQKDTYLHKYRNLLKPFLIVACDGYIVDCVGPYKATTSDADIMTSLFRNENSSLRSYLQADDIFILDRGFRDSISLLQDCNYRAYIPETLLEGEHQLTTLQANKSRCVTICRWVVEVVNGYFKRDFKLLRHEYFNKNVPHMMQDFSIAASLLNRFGVRLRNRDDAEEMLTILRERMLLQNNLALMVENTNMNRRYSNFDSITADRDNLITFPRMEMNELILFALGTYQIKQARSYYGEHIRFHGDYRIEVASESINATEHNLRGSDNNILIRGKIKSRHISSKRYYVYILIENGISGREGIIEYCCNCLVGRRTVGCCAHTMTLVWYLGWARHQSNISAPAEFLDSVVVREDIE